MKKIALNRYIKALVLSSVLVTTSCERDFLETDPSSSISYESTILSLQNMSTIINGMHRNMYVRQNSSQGQNGATAFLIMLDAMGEDMIISSTATGWFNSTTRWQDGTNANGSNIYYPYTFFYRQIRNANTVIAHAPGVTGDEALKERVLGEAYAFRAYSYFNLVQLYGKRYVPGANNTQLGVALRLDETENAIPRNTVEEVYAQINADLIKAATLLKGKARTSKSHFNHNVVNGLLARVALTQGRYSDAATYAKEARTGFSLMNNENYQKGFNDYSNGEWMWGYTIAEDQTDYFGNFMAYMSRNFNSTNIRSAPKVVNKLLFNLFPATDVRTQVIDPTGNHLGLLTVVDPATNKIVKKSEYSNYTLVPYTSAKFLVVNQSNSVGDVPFMRSAELYLIEAEALARSGNEAASKVVFTELEKNRNPQYTTTTATGQDYINAILNSRRLELWGEGFRFFDLKRLNQDLNRTGTNTVTTVINNVYTVPANDNRWTWLIPQTEIDNSGGVIVQNEL